MGNDYNYDVHQVDFLIQKSDSPNIDFYHGVLHINDGNSRYFATAEVINDLTGDKGTINMLKREDGMYYDDGHIVKCDLEILLEHYDPMKSINEVTRINRTFMPTIFGDDFDQLLIDHHNLLLMDPSKVDASEPAITVLIHNGVNSQAIKDDFFGVNNK